MAIDGTVKALPDTPENVAVFGRHHRDRGPAAFPQVQSVYLAGRGTHAIVDAGFWPCHTSERLGAFRVLRSVTGDLLVRWDRGLHDFDRFLEVWQRGAHALGRLPAHVKPTCVERLADGSILAYLDPRDPQRRKRGEHLVERLDPLDDALLSRFPRRLKRLLFAVLMPVGIDDFLVSIVEYRGRHERSGA